jgi:hypothetical protein
MGRSFLAVCALLAGAVPCRAQPFVEHLEPPVLQRGKVARLTAVGTRLDKALGLWASLPAGKVEAKVVGKGQAVFDVRVADDAPVGLFGLRVATADGLSNVHLCLIDDLPVRPAPPPGERPVKVALPCALWGKFREAEVDRFAIEVKAGQRVSFEAVGNRLGRDVDPLVTIRDASGRLVAERDNDPGLYFDCRFEHTFAAAGTYTVELRDSRFHGDEHGYYVLRMGRFPAARVAVPAALRPGRRAELILPELKEVVSVTAPAGRLPGPFSLTLRRAGDEGSAWLPVESGDAPAFVAGPDAVTPDTAAPAQAPGQLCGVLARPGERQYFRLALARGQSIQVCGHARWHNSPVDPEVTVTDNTGRVLSRANEGPDDTVRLSFTAPATGDYFLAVRDLARDGGPAYAYRLEVQNGAPLPEITTEVEGLTVPREAYQPVALAVTRNGYTGPIPLTLLGAPAGVSLSPDTIPPGADRIVCKLSAGPSTPLGLHTLQILTEVKWGPKRLVRVRPMIDRQRVNVDLIPFSLREDQRRPPPSVGDRLALQVVPAVPFTVEVAVPTVTLARYQRADIPLVTTRRAGFDGPISFTARGGQLADKNEGRTRMYAEFPQATAKALTVAGSVHSRILTNLGKTHIEVLASASHDGRTVTLVRTFELEARTAFTVAGPPAPVKIGRGGTARARLKVERVKTFAGPIKVQLSPTPGLELPETVVVPRGATEVEVEVRADATAAPGRRGVSLSSSADVDGFEEEQRGRIEVEVAAPEKPKK